MSKNLKKCVICGRRYRPDPRTAKTQKACPRRSCRVERVRRKNANWLKRHPLYGKSRRLKIRAWAKAYPDYWRAYRAALKLEIPCLKLEVEWPSDTAAIEAAMQLAEPIGTSLTEPSQVPGALAEEAAAVVLDDSLRFRLGGDGCGYSFAPYAMTAFT